MDLSWNEVVTTVLSNFLKLIVLAVIPYITSLVIKKVKNDHAAKYIGIASDIVAKCVSYVDQIYVDNLKEDGMFNAEAQRQAFLMCKERVLAMLNEEAKKVVIEMYGDLENWVTNAIEQSVRENKFSYISEGLVTDGE